MKNIFLAFLASISVLSGAGAQDKSENRVCIDVFYGGPNFISRVIDVASLNNASNSLSGFGPVGIRADFFVAKRLSLGLEVHHARSGYKRSLRETMGSQTYFFRDELVIDRTRIYPRLAIHFGSDPVDAFWYVAAGYARWATEYRQLENTGNYFSGVQPVRINRSSTLAIRTGFGVRYFFNDNFGINGDVGIGGPLVTGGFSFRF